MAVNGEKLWEEVVEQVIEIRQRLKTLPGLDLLDEDNLNGTDFVLDPTKLVISAGKIGLSGEQLAKILREKYKIQPEYADNNHVLLIITPGNSKDDLCRLIEALTRVAELHSGSLRENSIKADFGSLPRGKLEVSPRQAYNSEFVLVSLEHTIGEIAAELVCPYPPGIPVICPGERISAEAVAYLQQARETGASIYGLDKLGRIAVLS